MDDLIEFLRARLAEDEQAARAAFGKWGGVEGTDWIIEVGLPLDEWQPPGYGNNLGSIRWEEHRAHIARHDPARVLREVEAKRRIVERYAWLREHGDTGDVAWVLPLLATVYVDHPDYQPEWAPSA